MSTVPQNKNKATQPTLLDWLKPRRGVAISRLKNNGFAMIVALLVAQLSPVTPSPLTSLWVVLSGGGGTAPSTRLLCWIGVYTSFDNHKPF